MAEFAPAVEKTLRAEGGFAHVAATGEVVNFGVTHWFLRGIDGSKIPRNVPASMDEIQRVRNLRKDQAVEIYRQHFWDANRCSEIHDQAIAERLFDLSVNTGTGTAAKMLQRAVNVAIWPESIAEDGKIGPKTIAAVNDLTKYDGKDLLNGLKAEAAKHYRRLAHEKPVLADNLPGWLSRLQLDA